MRSNVTRTAKGYSVEATLDMGDSVDAGNYPDIVSSLSEYQIQALQKHLEALGKAFPKEEDKVIMDATTQAQRLKPFHKCHTDGAGRLHPPISAQEIRDHNVPLTERFCPACEASAQGDNGEDVFESAAEILEHLDKLGAVFPREDA